MASFFSRIALLGVGVVAGALLYRFAADAPPPVDIAQARIDGAIAAYTEAREAERVAASNALVANRENDLERNPNTPVLGNPDGDVALISFFDYTCVFCKAVEPRVRRLLQDDGGVKLVLKDFPVLTPESLIASKAALASRYQGLYEAYHNALMDFRGQLSEARIFEIAEEVGLDVARLRADMETPEIADQIIDNYDLARALRVYQTPTFIIDGHIVTQPSAEIDFRQLVSAARLQ